MTVQPLRLFGDPILRTKAEPVVDFDRELRHPRRRSAGDHARPGRCRAGRPADRRRAAGVRLPRRRRRGPHGEPDVERRRRHRAVRPEGCLSIPGLRFDCRRFEHVVATGWDLHGEPQTVEGTALVARAIQHETDHLDGVLFLDKLDAETRREAMGRDPPRSWFDRPRRHGEAEPAPAVRAGAVDVRIVFAGTPEPALPPCGGLLASERHEVVAVVTRPDAPVGRSKRPQRSPVGAPADEAGIPVLTPVKASEPAFLDALRELAPECCPVVAYGNLLRREALDVPAHGWVNLHFSLLPAWRGAAPVQAAIRAGDEVTGRKHVRPRGAWTPGPVYGAVTEEIGRHDTAGDAARAPGDVRRDAAGAGPSTGSPTASCPRRPARRRRLVRPEGHRRRRPRHLDPPGARGRPAVRAVTPAPAPGRRSATRASRSAPC